MDVFDLESNDNLNPRLQDTFNGKEGSVVSLVNCCLTIMVHMYVDTATESPGLGFIMEAKKGYSTRVIRSTNTEFNNMATVYYITEEEKSFLAIDSARQAQETLYMNIDTYKIEQVIRNLITNAVRLLFLCTYFYY